VFSGKQSLDYSGGVSAEDNFGIGGYDSVMGPNGQAQYWAPNLQAACEILFSHYDHAYVVPGERFPRRVDTSDPVDRNVRDFPHDHPSSEFTTVGDIFSASTNKDRKKPFDIRTVMRSIVDQDDPALEWWADMADTDTSVVFTREVNRRTAADATVRDLEAQLADSTDDAARARLRVKLAETRTAVRSDKLGEVAAEFEAVHNVERARQVGSVHSIIPAAELRPRIIAAVERGMARTSDAPSR